MIAFRDSSPRDSCYQAVACDRLRAANLIRCVTVLMMVMYSRRRVAHPPSSLGADDDDNGVRDDGGMSRFEVAVVQALLADRTNEASDHVRLRSLVHNRRHKLTVRSDAVDRS